MSHEKHNMSQQVAFYERGDSPIIYNHVWSTYLRETPNRSGHECASFSLKKEIKHMDQRLLSLLE